MLRVVLQVRGVVLFLTCVAATMCEKQPEAPRDVSVPAATSIKSMPEWNALGRTDLVTRPTPARRHVVLVYTVSGGHGAGGAGQLFLTLCCGDDAHDTSASRREYQAQNAHCWPE